MLKSGYNRVNGESNSVENTQLLKNNYSWNKTSSRFDDIGT